MDSHFQDVDYGFADEEVMEDQINACGTLLEMDSHFQAE